MTGPIASVAKNAGRVPYVVPMKFFGATPMIVVGLPFTVSILPIHPRVRAEVRLPEPVREHDRRSSSRFVIGSRNQTAERRPNLQGGKVAARYEESASRERVSSIAYIRANVPMAGDGAERGQLRVLQVAKHRVAQDVVARAGLTARCTSILRARSAEVHQSVGTGYGELLPHHAIEDRVDRRVGADAETEGECRDRSDERGATERPKGEPEVAHEWSHQERVRSHCDRPTSLPWAGLFGFDRRGA